jgi:hypothetical protein
MTDQDKWANNVAESQAVESAAPRGPIVILTYAHAGDELLSSMLTATGDVGCTTGTGLLPLCHSAARTWQSVESRGSVLSALAIKSIRVLIAAMTVTIRSRSGATRWCETAYAGSSAAESFLQIFPETQFICLHRRLDAVFSAGLRAYPFGLGSSPFWSHAAGHPGDNLAIIADYWAAHSEQLLEFEEKRPGCVIRIRYEDLVNEGQSTARAVFDYLGIPHLSSPLAEARPDVGHEEQAGGPLMERMPGLLRTRISDLYTKLDYHLDR